MTHEENFNQDSDLVKINDLSQNNLVIIYADQLNQYYHTLLGNPFQRLKYYDSTIGQYQFYRTPGMINYIIRYYIQNGCLSTDVNYPVEILYDELVFFGFNIQIIYDIISHCITIDYYIPSGKYRRALWLTFDSDLFKYKNYLNRSLSSFITISSILTSFTFVELVNNHEIKFLLKKTLIIEIFILTFVYVELIIRYFIRPKLHQTTPFLIVVNFISLLPIALFLFIWSMPPKWLYNLLVIQYTARIIRSVRLSSYAYEIVCALTEQLSIYIESFQSIILICIFFALIILSFEQISTPVKFLPKTNEFRSYSEIIWISFNAFTSLGEGTSRPLTIAGLIIEFLTCFIGIITIPQYVQIIYTIVSNRIDKQNVNNKKRKKTHLVMIEDEHGNKAIGQVNVDDQGTASLPEILIQKDEF